MMVAKRLWQWFDADFVNDFDCDHDNDDYVILHYINMIAAMAMAMIVSQNCDDVHGDENAEQTLEWMRSMPDIGYQLWRYRS